MVENKPLERGMKKFFHLIICLLLFCVEAISQQVFPLYTDTVYNPQYKSDNLAGFSPADQPTLQVYFPEKNKQTGTAVIIFPGGGYLRLAYEEEGTEVATLFAKQGITAIVVKYRLPRGYRGLHLKGFALADDRYMCPLKDAQQAIKRVRMNANAWHLDSNKIGIIGFSAGGHVASSLGTHFNKSYIPNKENTNLRPDFMILVYPVISMKDKLAEEGSKSALLVGNRSPEIVQFFSNEEQVSTTTPPTYITHTGDDEIVHVENSIVFYQALVRHKVPAEMHLYPKGNHSFILFLQPAEWLNPIFSWMKKGDWLKEK